MSFVYACAEGAVADPSVPGAFIMLEEDKMFAADHPLVLARPELFADHPPKMTREAAAIEQTTAAPGEFRNTRRRG